MGPNSARPMARQLLEEVEVDLGPPPRIVRFLGIPFSRSSPLHDAVKFGLESLK